MNINRTVWVIQQPPAGQRVDFSSAEALGDIRYLLPANSQPSKNPADTLEFLGKATADMRDGDYLVNTPHSDPLASVLVGILLGEQLNRFVWLRWDRDLVDGNRLRTGYYTQVDVELI